MSEKKNIILAFGNKEFNDSLIELKDHLNFDLEVVDNINNNKLMDNYQGFIIHEDALNNKKTKNILKNDFINKIIIHQTKNIKGIENIEKLPLPATIDQINKAINNNFVKKKFLINSSLKINNYILNKNTRQLIKDGQSLELTEKEIELIELLKDKSFQKKREILTSIWKYSKDADTHTVETHIYRLRKKINDTFKDDKFIKSEKEGYTI